jgi:hypothetical protein
VKSREVEPAEFSNNGRLNGCGDTAAGSFIKLQSIESNNKVIGFR